MAQLRPGAVARTLMADRMGFAWEPEEYSDMTLSEATEIVRDHEERSAEGQLSNEDSRTILYARSLIVAHGRVKS